MRAARPSAEQFDPGERVAGDYNLWLENHGRFDAVAVRHPSSPERPLALTFRADDARRIARALHQADERDQRIEQLEASAEVRRGRSPAEELIEELAMTLAAIADDLPDGAAAARASRAVVQAITAVAELVDEAPKVRIVTAKSSLEEVAQVLARARAKNGDGQ